MVTYQPLGYARYAIPIPRFYHDGTCLHSRKAMSWSCTRYRVILVECAAESILEDQRVQVGGLSSVPVPLYQCVVHRENSAGEDTGESTRRPVLCQRCHIIYAGGLSNSPTSMIADQ